jgi:hypothetical protein
MLVFLPDSGRWRAPRTVGIRAHFRHRVLSSFPALMRSDHDESSATTLTSSGVGAEDGWHVEDGNFANARLSNTP